jgi:putative transposase
VDDLVKALGSDTGISKSEVSRICDGLDEELSVFRTRPLDHTRFPYRPAPAACRSPTISVSVSAVSLSVCQSVSSRAVGAA